MSEDIQTSEVNVIPSWFRVAAILALVWNLLGVMAFVSHIMITPEMIAELSQKEQALYDSVPLWATIAFTVAVFAGALGSIALLMKKSICYPLFIASLVAVLVQMFHSFIMSNSYEVYGPGGTIMPLMVIVIALILVRFAAKGKKNNWFS
ncbi:hypothetical protein [Colwellia sp. BRX10-3]|uniref:hypothetical protein n=1 Tax=Colwellia sp. BRX10-3 TaxID=2759844 RepID=UPI00217566A7|nr:hypothetical protein [Colwellia sp. BRX10-3]